MDRGKDLLWLKEVRKREARKPRFAKEIVQIFSPLFTQGVGRPSIPRTMTFLASSEKEICETGVALHPRLQDRASFGDYCRGATPG